MVFGVLENAEQYYCLHSRFRQAFEFLKGRRTVHKNETKQFFHFIQTGCAYAMYGN